MEAPFLSGRKAMKGKSQMCTTLAQMAPIQSSGRGELLRITVSQQVHAGPKPALEREVHLVLTPEETFQTAVTLLGMLPITALRGPMLDLLEKYVKMGKTNDTNTGE